MKNDANMKKQFLEVRFLDEHKACRRLQKIKLSPGARKSAEKRGDIMSIANSERLTIVQKIKLEQELELKRKEKSRAVPEIVTNKLRSSSLSSLGTTGVEPENLTLNTLALSPGKKLKSMSIDATFYYDTSRLETPSVTTWKAPSSGMMTLGHVKANPYKSLKKIMTMEQGKRAPVSTKSGERVSLEGVSLSRVKGISKY